MKKLILVALLSLTSSFGETLYTQEYLPLSNIHHKVVDTGIKNYVHIDEFFYKKGKHLKPLYFDDGKLIDTSKDNLDKMIKVIKDKKYIITLISHTSYKITEEDSVKLNFWSEFWHSLGQFGLLTHQESIDIANGYLKETLSYLKQNGIDTTRIYTENRLDKDRLSTEATSGGRDINNRVDITLYNL
jgi:ribulose bisphosphate carboxylase small subunit